MSQSMGSLDFFLMESGEYLERLDALAQAPAGTPPAIDEFVRLARAFRGSAIMASQHGMGRAAQGLESAARALRDGRLAWNENTRGEVIRGIDDCKVLMRRLRTPEQGDTEKADSIGVRLDRLSGRASAAMRAAAGPSLDAGGRAFVAREASSIASVLQNVSRTLRANPGARDALNGVAAAMSALRGVAVLNDLPPLSELLAAVEWAVKDPDAGADVFEDAAKALARAAREVVDAGRPDNDSAEAKAFAGRLFATLGGPGTMAVEALFFDDEGPHILHQGQAPAPAPSGQSYGRVEMVSQGEYLNAAATELSKAGEGVQRDLRLYAIAASMRPMMPAGGAPLASGIGQLAAAVRDAVGNGSASFSSMQFTTHLRLAADALASAGSGNEEELARRVREAASGIARLKATEATEAREATEETEATTPAAAVASVSSVASLAPVASVASDALTASYMTLEQLMSEGAPSQLATLFGMRPTRKLESRADDELPIVPVESLAPDEDGVPVETLLYQGDAALRRVLALKGDLVAAASTPGPRLDALIHEVLDLVELSLHR